MPARRLLSHRLGKRSSKPERCSFWGGRPAVYIEFFELLDHGIAIGWDTVFQQDTRVAIIAFEAWFLFDHFDAGISLNRGSYQSKIWRLRATNSSIRSTCASAKDAWRLPIVY